MFRWCGRAAGIVLFVAWLALVAAEAFRQGPPSSETYMQGAALAIVFAGYLAGWWNELVGGVMAIVGTFAFVAICAVATQIFPRPETIWFAVPGICYLLARSYERAEGNLTRGRDED
jgi:hypothetical protein